MFRLTHVWCKQNNSVSQIYFSLSGRKYERGSVLMLDKPRFKSPLLLVIVWCLHGWLSLWIQFPPYLWDGANLTFKVSLQGLNEMYYIHVIVRTGPWYGLCSSFKKQVLGLQWSSRNSPLLWNLQIHLVSDHFLSFSFPWGPEKVLLA